MSIMPLCLAGEVVNGMMELLMDQTMQTISEKQLVVSESVQVWFKVSILGIKIPIKSGSFLTKSILKMQMHKSPQRQSRLCHNYNDNHYNNNYDYNNYYHYNDPKYRKCMLI